MSYFTGFAGDFPPGAIIARRGYGPTPTGLGGVLDTIGSFVKDGVSAAVDFYKTGQQQAGQAAAYKDIATQQAALAAQRQQAAGMPGWVMPVALLGGAGLIAAVLLSGKRKNPARRRHAGNIRSGTLHGAAKTAHAKKKRLARRRREFDAYRRERVKSVQAAMVPFDINPRRRRRRKRR